MWEGTTFTMFPLLILEQVWRSAHSDVQKEVVAQVLHLISGNIAPQGQQGSLAILVTRIAGTLPPSIR